MPQHVTVNFPNLPPGAKVTIPGLGDLENGKEYDVTDEEIAAAKANGYELPLDGKLGFDKSPEGPTKGTDDPFWDRIEESEAVTGGEAE